MVRYIVHAAAFAAFGFSSATASAQYGVMPSVIGNTIGNMVASGKEHECMMGSVPMVSRTDAARLAAGVTLRDYLTHAGAAGGDATPAFTRKAKLRALVVDGTPVSSAAVVDAGQPAPGHYRGLFRREGEGWKLTRLEAATGAAGAAPVLQYCHAAGDVEPYKIATAEREAERERKRAAKAARRAAQAQQRAST